MKKNSKIKNKMIKIKINNKKMIKKTFQIR